MTCAVSPGQVCFTCAVGGLARCPFKAGAVLPLVAGERPKVVYSGVRMWLSSGRVVWSGLQDPTKWGPN